MKNRSINPLKGLFFLSVCIFPPSNAFAALDEFSPYAFVRALYDDNIFRSFEDEEDDIVGHVGAGVKTDLKLSRQHLLFEGVVDRSQYDNFDELNNTKVDGTANWAWQVGNLWSGDLGYTYNREMASFTQQLIREKDMRTTNTGFFKAGYQLHPDWRVAAGIDISDISYQDRDRLDRDTSTAQFEVQYRNTLNTRVGVSVQYSKNDLQDTEINGASLDNDYDEITVSGLFYWELSGKSALDARLGYTDLSYDELDDRDFQGGSGRMTFKWVPTGKTKIDIAAWQETSTLRSEIADYVLSRGFSVKPVWSATSKISIVGEVSFENEDFKGSNEIRDQLGLQKRDDDTWIYRILANWDPRRYLRFSLGYKRSERDSSIDVRDFDDNQVDAKVKFSF